MASHMLVVLSNPTEGDGDALNRWYRDIHLDEVLDVEGFVSAQAFQLSSDQIGGATGLPYRNLAVYQIETDNLAAAADRLMAAKDRMNIDPSLDFSRTVMWLFTPFTERVEAPGAAAQIA